jgi:hypothetical protein
MEGGEPLPDRVNRDGLPAQQDGCCGGARVVAAHLDDVVDRTRVAAVGQSGSGPVAHDRADTEVDLGREAAVEPHLLVAHGAPASRRRVVHERQGDGLLEFVDALLGEEDPGDRRLAQLHRPALAVDAGVLQRCDEPVGVAAPRHTRKAGHAAVHQAAF